MKYFVLATFLITTSIQAFEMTPMISTIDSSSSRKSTVGLIINDDDRPVAIELKALKRTADINGEETNTDELEDLVIFPPQLIVPAKSKKTFKVTYIGKIEGDVEKNYRIVADESNVDLIDVSNKKSSVRFKVTYVSALYVSPKKAVSNVTVKSIKILDDSLELLVSNDGNRHQNLDRLKVTFLKNKDDKNPVILASKDLPKFNKENILAKSERLFHIKKTTLLKEIDPTYLVRLEFSNE